MHREVGQAKDLSAPLHKKLNAGHPVTIRKFRALRCTDRWQFNLYSLIEKRAKIHITISKKFYVIRYVFN
jgi:hypothetical protein